MLAAIFFYVFSTGGFLASILLALLAMETVRGQRRSRRPMDMTVHLLTAASGALSAIACHVAMAAPTSSAISSETIVEHFDSSLCCLLSSAWACHFVWLCHLAAYAAVASLSAAAQFAIGTNLLSSLRGQPLIQATGKGKLAAMISPAAAIAVLVMGVALLEKPTAPPTACSIAFNRGAAALGAAVLAGLPAAVGLAIAVIFAWKSFGISSRDEDVDFAGQQSRLRECRLAFFLQCVIILVALIIATLSFSLWPEIALRGGFSFMCAERCLSTTLTICTIRPFRR